MMAEQQQWRERAACRDRDTELWFAPEDSQMQREAVRICVQDCPVRSECLAHALTKPESDGVWGGYTTEQRRQIRRSRGMLRNQRKPPVSADAPAERGVSVLTDEEQNGILAELDAGHRVADVRERYRVSKDACYRLWRRHRDGPIPAARNRSAHPGGYAWSR